MKRYFLICLTALFAIAFYSCDDYETYAEQKEKEKEYINDFIEKEGIKEIDMETFKANGYVTDTATNEYVHFKDKGVYMQIVRKGGPDGKGEPMADGQQTLLVRYQEYNIESGNWVSANWIGNTPDVMTVTRNGSSFTAYFNSGYMLSYYGNVVPKGWLLPWSYVSPTRIPDADGFQGAHVKIILPHGEGTASAGQYVYPTFYEIKYLYKTEPFTNN